MNHLSKISVLVLALMISACGLKVVNPEDEKNKGTMAVDWSAGKIVATYTCKLVGVGKTYRAIGKSEEEATKEVVAQCHSGTIISICNKDKVSCWKN